MEESNVDLSTPDQTFRTVPCSQCNFPILPNSRNALCLKCFRSKSDITLGLPSELYLLRCPRCENYRDPSNAQIKLRYNSKHLLAFCTQKLEKYFGSNNLTLLRSQTIPSQPDSNIIQIRVTVQKQVPGGFLQQSHDVEFLPHNRMCEPCARVQPDPDQWNSIVQLKHPPYDMRSFYHLEHVILKHFVASNYVRMNKMKHGIEFFFPNRVSAKKFLDFIKRQVPVRVSESGGFCYRYNFSVELCPIYRQDLIFLPPKVALSLGDIGPIVICTKVNNVITLLDPLTSIKCCLDGDTYWREPFKALLTGKELVEYTVLDVKEVCSKVTIDGKIFGLANAEVARVKDLGKNDTRFTVKTHLGYVLKTGDRALGYDLWGANCGDSEIELKEHIGGGVILMKKTCESKSRTKRRAEHHTYLKYLEEITNEVLGMSLGDEESHLEEKLGDLNLSGEEYKEKKKARRTA